MINLSHFLQYNLNHIFDNPSLYFPLFIFNLYILSYHLDLITTGKVTIQDSNGICGVYRVTCTATPNFSKASVIHPK
jgi:hypothetical protein